MADAVLWAVPIAFGAYVVAEYDRCAERWHEALLGYPDRAGPVAGPGRVSQQPVNADSNLVTVSWAVLLAAALGTDRRGR